MAGLVPYMEDFVSHVMRFTTAPPKKKSLSAADWKI